ncbi:hypothetical protein [Arthrobacter sp. JCM 19049]|uniref:hypothetical protein n=1 Tax=Arthrobacter sp. JCM 19049 TaxID=1460643 RepID=UPI002436C6D3|nr:hypothetical protein [Arthrobacter sp. JCM 19049]
MGGTITLAAYGYWLREKGWYTPKWMRVMRLDNSMAYVITGVFVIAMLVVGAEVVRSAGVALSAGDAGLLDLTDVLQEATATWWASASWSASGPRPSPRSSACGTAFR